MLLIYPVPNPAWMIGYPYYYEVIVPPTAGGQQHRRLCVCKLSQPHRMGCDVSLQLGQSISWTTVSFDAQDLSIREGVKVLVKADRKWSNCTITPVHMGIPCPTGDGYTASFVVTRSMTKVSVEFDPVAPNDSSRVNNVVADALMVFVDPIGDAAPNPSGVDVLFYGYVLDMTLNYLGVVEYQ